MTGALRAEWTKLRTISSSAWLVASIALLTIGLGAAIAASVNTSMCPTPSGCLEDTTKLSLSGVWAGQLVAAIFAALVITNEYGNRLIMTTLAARPRRVQVFCAKAAVVLAGTLTAASIGVVVSLGVGRLILAGNGFSAVNGYSPLSLGDGPTLRAAAGTVLYLALIALLSLGLGAVIRDTAVSLTVVLALLFVVPVLIEFISDPVWHERLMRLSPTTAGLAIQSTIGLDDLPIAPWPGLGVLALYAVGSAAAGVVLFTRRDA